MSSPEFPVLLGPEAARDLQDIDSYIAAHDGLDRADAAMERLESAIASLATLPLRGKIPAELESVGISRYRELLESPWRIIYEPLPTAVYVHWIFDARRDVASQLTQKIFRA